jgi:hypothetical protein
MITVIPVKEAVAKVKANHSLSLRERARVRGLVIKFKQINLLKIFPLTSILSPRRGSINKNPFATASFTGMTGYYFCISTHRFY